LLDKWLKILPDPFTVTGRIFFEHVPRDNLDIGRADQIGLIFDRRVHCHGPRPTPGRFRTRVITAGVTPSLHADYKHTTIKQYHKEGRALRTETTINDTRDFGIGKRLVNLPALREIGFSANRRLLGVQRLDHDPIAGIRHLRDLTEPVRTNHGTKIPGLRLGQPRSHALLSALLTFRTHIHGFSNRDLRDLTAELRGLSPTTITASQATYDLRRLRTHHLIEPIPHTHRYRVTDQGLATTMLLVRIHERLLPTGLDIHPATHGSTQLQAAAAAYQRALDRLTEQTGLAA